MIKNFLKKLLARPTSSTIVPSYPIFDIGSAYHKLYEANGQKEVTLTVAEADALLDYLQYVAWLTNPPKDTEWYKTLAKRSNVFSRKL